MRMTQGGYSNNSFLLARWQLMQVSRTPALDDLSNALMVVVPVLLPLKESPNRTVKRLFVLCFERVRETPGESLVQSLSVSEQDSTEIQSEPNFGRKKRLFILKSYYRTVMLRSSLIKEHSNVTRHTLWRFTARQACFTMANEGLGVFGPSILRRNRSIQLDLLVLCSSPCPLWFFFFLLGCGATSVFMRIEAFDSVLTNLNPGSRQAHFVVGIAKLFVDVRVPCRAVASVGGGAQPKVCTWFEALHRRWCKQMDQMLSNSSDPLTAELHMHARFASGRGRDIVDRWAVEADKGVPPFFTGDTARRLIHREYDGKGIAMHPM
jgi:hypothetical protein